MQNAGVEINPDVCYHLTLPFVVLISFTGLHEDGPGRERKLMCKKCHVLLGCDEPDMAGMRLMLSDAHRQRRYLFWIV